MPKQRTRAEKQRAERRRVQTLLQKNQDVSGSDISTSMAQAQKANLKAVGVVDAHSFRADIGKTGVITLILLGLLTLIYVLGVLK